MSVEPRDVVDDVAARREHDGRRAHPGRAAREGVVGVPGDPARTTYAADRLLGEPLAGEAVGVPELGYARVGEDIAVPGRARVAGEHRQPDGEHLELRVRMGVEDVRADPTGPQEADASGRADEDDQARLAGALVERPLQLSDRVQVREVPRRNRRGAA